MPSRGVSSVVTRAFIAIAGTCACAASAQQPLFADGTEAAGIYAAFGSSLGLTSADQMTAGGAVGDFDRDGDQDLFVLAGDMGVDKLYINDGSGQFTDQAAAWGIARQHRGSGAAVADVNGDGWLDIYVTSHGPAGERLTPGANLLYINNGNGGFTEQAIARGVARTAPSAADGFGAAFGDYDLDGDLDLFVTGWKFEAGGNKLFRNDGDGFFEDVTAVAIPFDLLPMHGFSPWFHDMDGDRYPDLLVAADFDTSRYFANNGDGTFSDVTAASGTALDSNGMGATIADFNGDGRPDWYVTSIEGGTGPGQRPDMSGNMLYMSLGQHRYAESSVANGVNAGGWGWGADSQDFDLDGVVDILWTNGWLEFPTWLTDPTFLCTGNGDGTFAVTTASGITHDQQGRGVATFDADGDGDREIVIFSVNVPVVLYEGLAADGGNSGWLRVALDTSADRTLAPDGIGAQIRATTAGMTQHRWISASSQYLAQSEMAAHFGFGDATSVDSLEVIWPDGRVTVLAGIAASQSLTIAAECPADFTGNGGRADYYDAVSYLDAVVSGLAEADFDDQAGVDSGDVLAFADRLAACRGE
ncbi:MAG: CRTAC1 family protein [Planctomycetota bacterium]